MLMIQVYESLVIFQTVESILYLIFSLSFPGRDLRIWAVGWSDGPCSAEYSIEFLSIFLFPLPLHCNT